MLREITASRRVWGSALTVIVILMLLVGGAPSRAAVPVETATPTAQVTTTPSPTPDPATARYFSETGFWVDGLFTSYWERNGGLMTFGYPITRVFYQDGLHRQYFERAIFEHHENETGDWRVQIVRLGAVNTVERRNAASEAAFIARDPDPLRDAGGIYFPETGLALSATFRDYWERNGGVQTFGYPLSDEFTEPGVEDGAPRPVQYFERARFEWHAEYAGSEFEVLLGHLGREALAQRDIPPLAITPQEPTTRDRDAPPLGPLPVGEPSSPGCGFNLAFWGEIDNDRANAEYLDLAAQSGCEWIRLQFTWSDLEPTRGADINDRLDAYDRVVNHARAIGLQLLVDVTHPPSWARPADRRLPADPAAFGSFMARLVARFEGRVAAWQIWNEPNLVDETNGIIDPAGFLPLLRAGSLAVRAADPGALVVFPGLAPTSMMYADWAIADDWYLEALLSLNNGEAARYFDVLGVQGYGAGNPPDTYWPGNLASNPAWTEAPEFYFRHVERLHTVMLDLGLGGIPIWITEMGWPAGKTADVYGYGAYVTPELQAAYLTRAYEIIRTEWDWVENAFVWHLNAAAYGGAESAFAGFSITDADGTPRPAFDAIRTQRKRWQSEAAP